MVAEGGEELVAMPVLGEQVSNHQFPVRRWVGGEAAQQLEGDLQLDCAALVGGPAPVGVGRCRVSPASSR